MWGTIRAIGIAIVDSIPALLIVLGVVLILLGAAGGVTYRDAFPIAEAWARGATGVLGFVLVVLGLLAPFLDRDRVPNARNYGIVISEPTGKTPMPRYSTARGTFRKVPPTGHELRLLRLYSGNSLYYPLREVAVDRHTRTWETRCDLAGKEGDTRIIAAYLVGPSGRMLLRYFKDAEQVHNKTIQGIEDPLYLPLLQEKTADMVECCRVEVVRGP